MSPSRRVAWIALVVGSVALLLIATRVRALGRARDAVDREATALARASGDLRELSLLQVRREVVAPAKRPTRDVIAQVNTILRDAGIPTDRLKNLEPEADVPLAGRYRTQTIRLSLDRLTLRELGSFLATWRGAATVWTPRALELTHVATPEGGDAGFDARVVVAATYLSDRPEEPAR